jgi:hypothetical protein
VGRARHVASRIFLSNILAPSKHTDLPKLELIITIYDLPVYMCFIYEAGSRKKRYTGGNLSSLWFHSLPRVAGQRKNSETASCPNGYHKGWDGGVR